MKTKFLSMMITTATVIGSNLEAIAQPQEFRYIDEQFADIQMLRYKVNGFDDLTLKEKTFIYYLSEAALQGRDILFDQNGRYNLRIRRAFEKIYTDYKGDRTTSDFLAFEVYLKRLWFSAGIHHHYGSEKFKPEFSESWLRTALKEVGHVMDEEIFPVIFDKEVMPMRVNQKDGEDLLLTSAANYYAPGITQKEAETFYAERKAPADPRPIMTGMNSWQQR